MKKFSLLDFAALLIGLLPYGYLFSVYSSLPAIVPLHFDANGQPNGFGPKKELFLIASILVWVSILLYLLMKYLPSIDPKKQVQYGEKTFQTLGFGLVVFMAALNICITFATVNHSFQIDKIILPIIGLLFVFIGNMMYSIKLWVMGGLAVTIAMLLLPSPTRTYVFITCVVVMAFIPMIYSYIYFKKHQLK